MYNRESFQLREPIIQFGAYEDLDLIGPGDDPEDFFVPASNPLAGYIRMGTITVEIADSFVEYKSGTPHQNVRVDLLERMFTVKYTANQLELEAFSRYYNLLVVEGGVWNQYWIGYDTPVRPYYGLLLTSTKVNGDPLNVGVFYAQSLPATLSLSSKGTDYTDIPAEFRSFVHPDFETDPGDYTNAQKAYGIVFDPGTGSSSS